MTSIPTLPTTARPSNVADLPAGASDTARQRLADTAERFAAHFERAIGVVDPAVGRRPDRPLPDVRDGRDGRDLRVDDRAPSERPLRPEHSNAVAHRGRPDDRADDRADAGRDVEAPIDEPTSPTGADIADEPDDKVAPESTDPVTDTVVPAAMAAMAAVVASESTPLAPVPFIGMLVDTTTVPGDGSASDGTADAAVDIATLSGVVPAASSVPVASSAGVAGEFGAPSAAPNSAGDAAGEAAGEAAGDVAAALGVTVDGSAAGAAGATAVDQLTTIASTGAPADLAAGGGDDATTDPAAVAADPATDTAAASTDTPTSGPVVTAAAARVAHARVAHDPVDGVADTMTPSTGVAAAAAAAVSGAEGDAVASPGAERPTVAVANAGVHTPRDTTGAAFGAAAAGVDGAAFDAAAAEASSGAARTAADAAALRGPGLDRISIDLSDEGLGPLTLQAANGAGGLHVRLTAGDRVVGDALATAADQLRRDLEESGATLGSFDVGHRNDGHGARQQFASPDRSGSVQARSTERAAEAARRAATSVAALQPTGASATGLDLLI